MKSWDQITPQEFDAMNESEKRNVAQQILWEAFGESPADRGNKQKKETIEGLLNTLYGPAKTLDS